jgi:hypothetical protein
LDQEILRQGVNVTDAPGQATARRGHLTPI